jgi:hypothetical protein
MTDFNNVSYENPLLCSNFISEFYIPYFNSNDIMRYNEKIEYDLVSNKVIANFIGYEQGNFEKFINNIKKENIEFFGIYPLKDSLSVEFDKYYISCVFGSLEQYYSRFDLSKNDVLRGEIELKFYDIKIIQKNEKFDNIRYLDQVHKMIYEKILFKKL